MTEHSAVAVAATRLRLLGGWQLVVDGTDVELGHREQRLVSLLGLRARSVRGQVASTLWPDSTDQRALASLRRAVLQCRTVPRSAGRRPPDRWPSLRESRVDVDDLRRAVGSTRLPMTDLVARELLAAVRGDELLPGWYDDWAVEERDRLEQLRAEALERVAAYALEQGRRSVGHRRGAQRQRGRAAAQPAARGVHPRAPAGRRRRRCVARVPALQHRPAGRGRRRPLRPGHGPGRAAARRCTTPADAGAAPAAVASRRPCRQRGA